MSGHYLPIIETWPYKKVHDELNEFRLLHQEEPKRLIVGPQLWEMLISVSESKDDAKFCLQDKITVAVDTTAILEPHDFIFSVI